MQQLLWVFLVCLPLLTSAQNEYYQPKPVPVPNRPLTIILKDGTQLRGKLIRQDSLEAVIETTNLGQLRVPASQIVRIDQLVRPNDGVTFPNLFPQTMRLTPTAFPAEKNRFYLSNHFLYFSQFEYGITDNWSVGTTFFTIIPTAIFSLNTKVSFPVSNRVRLGVNAQLVALNLGTFLVRSGYGSIGYVQGVATIGDRQSNTTFGLGGSISNGELSRNYIGTFGLVRKVSPKLTFITENLVLVGGRTSDFATMLSGGVRFDRRQHAFDVALYAPLVFTRNRSADITVFPIIQYHLRVGK